MTDLRVTAVKTFTPQHSQFLPICISAAANKSCPDKHYDMYMV